MSQPLGLTRAREEAYLDLLTRGHPNPRWSYRLHDLDGNPAGTLPVPDDGEISVAADDDVTRSTTGTIYDPDGVAQFDSDNPLDGSVHLDRLLEIRHTVHVDELGGFDVTAVPFYGWVTKANRDGDTIALEAQGLDRRAMFGQPPLTIPARTYIVDAIRAILEQRCGERRFRFRSTNTARLSAAVSTGWDAENAPWAVVKRLADVINHQLYYSCDGWATLRPFPGDRDVAVAFEWPGNITVRPKASTDALALNNHARVTGKGKVAASRTAPVMHALSPRSLRRNGVDFYMPVLLEDEKYATTTQAGAAADQSLQAGLTQIYDQAITTTPLYHLDPMDIASITTPEFTGVAQLRSWKMDVAGDDIEFNRKLRVSNPAKSTIRA